MTGVGAARLFPVRRLLTIGVVTLLLDVSVWVLADGPRWRAVAIYLAGASSIMLLSCAFVVGYGYCVKRRARRDLDRCLVAATTAERSNSHKVFDLLAVRSPVHARVILRILAARPYLSVWQQQAVIVTVAQQYGVNHLVSPEKP